jgi:hypothetical protein
MATMRKRKHGRGKRTSTTRRTGKFTRKGARPIYKAKRGRPAYRIKRPTQSSIFKSVDPVKLINVSTGFLTTSAGIQAVTPFAQNPQPLSLLQLFAASFANAGTAATYSSGTTFTGAAGTYGDRSHVAIQSKVRTEFNWSCTAPGIVTVYRIQARDHIPTSQISNDNTGVNLNAYMQGLLGASSVAQLQGTAASNPSNVIGVTPFDCPTFTNKFKILSVKSKKVHGGSSWVTTWVTPPKIYSGIEVNSYGVLKGAIIDLFYIQGRLGMVHGATTGLANNIVTTTPGELIWCSKWEYAFAPEPATTLKAEKYINYQMPNSNNATGVAVNVDDTHVFADFPNYVVSAYNQNV